MTPSEVTAGFRGTLLLEGEGFYPAVHADFDDGAGTSVDATFQVFLERGGLTVEVSSVEWLGERQLVARVGDGLSHGNWRVRLLDPWGRSATLDGALKVRAECANASHCRDPTPCEGPPSCDDGICRYARFSEGTPCDDGLQCTSDSRCDAAGACAQGVTPACDTPPSSNGCFDAVGLCTEAAGCVYSPLEATANCDDGSGCTVNDRCDGQGGCAGTFDSTVTGCASNQAPAACLTVSETWGRPTSDPAGATTFTLSAACSSDVESGSALSFRFDFDGDGVWDFPADGVSYSSSAATTAQYGTEGLKRVIVEVRDDGAPAGGPLSSFAERRVAVASSAATLVVTADLLSEFDAGYTLESPGGRGLSLAEAVDYANTNPSPPRTIVFAAALTVLTGSSITGSPAGALKAAGAVVIGRPGLHWQFDGNSGATLPCFDLSGPDQALVGVTVTDCEGRLIQVNGPRARVAECTFTPGPRNAPGAAPKMQVSDSTQPLFIGPGNRFYGFGQGTTSEAMQLKGPKTQIRGNRFHDNGALVIDVNGQPETVIEENLFHDNGAAVVVSIGNNSPGSRVTYNTFHRNAGDAVRVTSSGNIGTISVRNNIFSHNLGTALVAQNDVFTPDGRSPNGFFNNGNKYNDSCATCVEVNADPKYQNPDHLDAVLRDFRLMPGSPMIGQADDLGPTQPDRNGPAPGLYNGTRPDLGAWEGPF